MYKKIRKNKKKSTSTKGNDEKKLKIYYEKNQ